MEAPSNLAAQTFFEKNKDIPLVIEGPEYTIDRSYKW